MSLPSSSNRRRVQRRTVALLSLAQVLSGVAAGSIVSVGSLLAVQLSGSDAWAGSVATSATLGAAVASLLLARLALARGRRASLATGLALASVGALGVVAAAVVEVFPLLLLSGALMGTGSAVNLQARFAATDLSDATSRARDLSLVVWMSTVGAVAGPNLVRFGSPISDALGLPELAALFVLSAAGMIAAMLVIWIGLRPDPLLEQQRLDAGRGDDAAPTTPPAPSAPPTPPHHRAQLAAAFRILRTHPAASAALVAILAAHAVMVAVMSMTPVHMEGHGASITLVGLTVSLHIAGMYALSPVMGAAADRFGGPRVLIGGLAVLALATLTAGLAGPHHAATTAGLVLLGLGWSAATVAGSAMIARTVPGAERVTVQGLTDSLMSLAGAGGGALAGVMLALTGYGGLNAGAGALAVAAIAVVIVVGRRRSSQPD
ncbi:MFS transporter [Serinibacter arcticus]|uniref:MFS transporter n=1 Tax=Serinibacter arcticus TaxID=1655435 RepID=UPI001F4915B9|nr:MFS transporter [Serinibacter arcticus]